LIHVQHSWNMLNERNWEKTHVVWF
jgi:hypothetical protein